MIDAVSSALPRQVWSVGALIQAVGDTLAARFSVCVVQGEISGFSRAASGHCYFSLKDAGGSAALVRCAMFRRSASLLDFTPGDGQRVELRARLAVYEPRGELQLVVEAMQRGGAGALYEQFLRLKARLEAQGLFDVGRKRPLPAHPMRVGVVTSLAAAALQDVLTTLSRRSPHVGVVIYPSAVQGVEAPPALAEAIALAGRRAEVDVLIVCRGGGSLEDLWAFNDERVVHAIAAAPMPVVCGVGHETDVTLADLAADLRAPTPTAAAELAAPSARDAEAWLATRANAIERRLRHLLDSAAQRLDRAALRLVRPADSVQRNRQRLELLAQRMHDSPARATQQGGVRLQALQERLTYSRSATSALRAQRLEAAAGRLAALDPQRVLARGYALLRDGAGAPVLSVAPVSPGAALQAVLADGTLEVAVTAVHRAASGG
jgi:exodeoxyribonuclease VII large subunit